MFFSEIKLKAPPRPLPPQPKAKVKPPRPAPPLKRASVDQESIFRFEVEPKAEISLPSSSGNFAAPYFL